MNRTPFVVYQTATGRILRAGSVFVSPPDNGESVAVQAFAGETAVIVAGILDQATTYIVTGVPTPRPPCPVVSNIVGRVITLTGVPANAAYFISGAADYIDVADASGTLVLTFGAPGTYRVAVQCFPAVDFFQEYVLP